MAAEAGGISDELKQLIYDHIDSVEQLDIMLLLRSQAERDWSVREIADHLRTNPASVERRLKALRALDILEETPSEPQRFRYRTKTEKAASLMEELAAANKVRRHRVLELIFSPTKRARNFADAFLVRNPAKKDDKDG